MATYLILNIVFLIAIFVVSFFYRRHVWTQATGAAILLLLLLTAVFDNLIIAANIVSYDSTKISGLFIGYAPVEDFAYSIAAVLLVAVVWNIMGRNK